MLAVSRVSAVGLVFKIIILLELVSQLDRRNRASPEMILRTWSNVVRKSAFASLMVRREAFRRRRWTNRQVVRGLEDPGHFLPDFSITGSSLKRPWIPTIARRADEKEENSPWDWGL
jgi:hypothetical protein